MVTIEEIKTVLNGLQDDVLLTAYGNENGTGSVVLTPTIDKANVEENAQCFNIDKIEKALLEIPNIFQKQRSTSRQNSYALKHILENDTGIYIGNGDFIMAMILLGYQCSFRQSVNPVFNVKKREEKSAGGVNKEK